MSTVFKNDLCFFQYRQILFRLFIQKVEIGNI